MLGPGLPEASEILCNRKIAGHSNFLTTTDTHAVHATDHGLVAAKNRRNHVVEEPHISPIFLGIARVVFRVFLGISASAKGFVARTGKHHGDYVASRACGAKSQDR